MNGCLVKLRRPSRPSGNVNPHTKQRPAVFECCCSCGERFSAALVARFACASKDCATTQPQGKADNDILAVPLWYDTLADTTATSLISCTGYQLPDRM